jgi:hypothetical protein
MASREDVLQILQRETLQRRKHNRQMRYLFGAIIVLCGVVMVARYVIDGVVDFSMITSMGCLVGGGMTIGLSPKMKSALQDMASDPAAIPYLVEALDSGDASLVPLARQILIQGLPNLRTEDAERFDGPARAALGTALRTTSDADFAVAALGALRHVGSNAELLAMDLAAKQQLVNLPKEQRERVGQLALSASADLRLRLAKTMVEARAGAVSEAYDSAARRLPADEAAEQSLSA